MTRNERWRKMSALGSIAMAHSAMRRLAHDGAYSLAVQLRAHSIANQIERLNELARAECNTRKAAQ